MTNTEAITKLTNIMHDDHYSWSPAILTAFGMAVDALKGAEAQSTQTNTPNTLNALDCISRAEAIDIVDKYFKKIALNGDICLDGLRQLPSAQPEQRWIPWNSGKFPEETGTYTVTAYDWATKRVTYAKYQKRLKRWELTGARAYWRVLAWMPRPEPWKEGEA